MTLNAKLMFICIIFQIVRKNAETKNGIGKCFLEIIFSVAATAITAGVGIAKVEDAEKVVERYKDLLSDAEYNLRSAREKLHAKEHEKEELEQVAKYKSYFVSAQQ